MFQEICRKLCEITDELTTRQDKLIEMASNLSKTQELPEKSFKELGNLGLKFKGKEEFGKLVDDHFSKDNVTVDFSFFSEDIKNIMSHLGKSNQLLEEVRAQAKEDADLRQAMNERINQVEASAALAKIELSNEIKELEVRTKKREESFEDKMQSLELKGRIKIVEQMIEQHGSLIDDANCKYVMITEGIAEQVQINEEKDKKLVEFKKKTEEILGLKLAEIIEQVNKKVEDIEQTLQTTAKVLGENNDASNDQVKAELKGQIDEINKKFEGECQRIMDDVKAIEEGCKALIDGKDKGFGQIIRDEIDSYEVFRRERAEQALREQEQERKRKEEEARRIKEEEDLRIN